MERADSAEKKARQNEQMNWYKAKIAIQNQSEILTQKKKSNMVGHIETSIEKKQKKLEEITKRREDNVQSRQA